MAISPINITRYSQNLRSTVVLDAIRRTQRELFLSQSRLASGRSFTTPSENPVGASRVMDLRQALSQQQQFSQNVQHGDNFLAAADSAMFEINDLMIQSSVIASQNVGSFSSASEREAEAELVARIRDAIQNVANRSLGGRFVFAGRETLHRPFVEALGGVAYVGDFGELAIRTGEGLSAVINVPGSELFGALSRSITSNVDLTPTLAVTTRLDAVVGTGGRPIQTGKFVINEVGGVGAFVVDLAGATSVGDLIDIINQAASEAGSSLTASLEDEGLTITPAGSPVTISEVNGGSTAGSLGLVTREAVTDPIVAEALAARVTRMTLIADLANGEGIDLEGGLLIDNGGNAVTIDLSEAETVQDLINSINGAGVFVLARVNDAGTGIDVFNRVSGSALRVGENGGTTAADLGIRTFDAATSLTELNGGRGLHLIEGEADLRITTKDGQVIDVNLDGAETIGDVITLIEEAAVEAGVNLTASQASIGNGLLLTDETGGTGDLTVGSINLSAAAEDLGFSGKATGDDNELVGKDVRPIRTEGIIDALVELEEALRTDDTTGITLAAERIDGLRDDVIRVQGIIGARSQTMRAKLDQMASATVATQQILSQVQDLDFAEAAIKLQSAVTQLQANLQTSSSLLSLSLLDFLR